MGISSALLSKTFSQRHSRFDIGDGPSTHKDPVREIHRCLEKIAYVENRTSGADVRQ